MSSIHDLPFNYETDEINKLKYAISRMEHELFFLYVFLTAENMCSEACEYLEEHCDDCIPFKTFL